MNKEPQAMAKRNEKKKNGIVLVVEKLQRGLSLARRRPNCNYDHCDGEFEQVGGTSTVPDDVKEGHFAVFALDDGGPKRFVVALSYLTHPAFLRLLEQAAEEFGFDQEGALTIPCQSSELERILGEQWKERDGSWGGEWDPCKSMVESC